MRSVATWTDLVASVCDFSVLWEERAMTKSIEDHMTRARALVERHIENYGMVPHPDRIKEAIAELSQQSFDLGFRAAGGTISRVLVSPAKRA